jgi:hypothetical protein
MYWLLLLILMSLSQQAKAIQSPFTSPEDLMKNLPKAMSNMFSRSGGMSGNSPTFRITMKEYEDMAINVGDRVGMEINKVDSGGI